ncbi:MAG: hypothetical protein N2507_03670 [Candidatus Bipolaricaulota bacterium]|nr:hypothetical protein [Candidatus Bipolaricaulota bacterium]
MKHVAVLLLIGGALGWALPICQYQAPTTNLLRGEATFNYRYYDDPLTAGPDMSTGRLALGGEWLVDSPARGVGLTFGGEFALHQLALATAAAQASGTFRQYPFPQIAYFVFGGVEGFLDTRLPRPGLEVRAGVGYGRFTDVTPMVRALRLEEKLLQRGVLLASLRESALLRLAQEIGRERLYPSRAELATALARLLEAEARVTLDPKSLFLIEEVLAEAGLERYCGWVVQFGLGYALLRPQAGAELTFHLALQGAVAPDPRSQILFKSEISGPYQVFEEYTWNLNASYSFRLNELATFLAQYALRQVKPRGQLPAGTQNATFQLVFRIGGASVTLQVGFSKVAEAPSWTQDLLIAAGWRLW